MPAVTTSPAPGHRALLAAAATAGALAVPLHAVATPVSAVVAGLAGALGLHVWRWSRLPSVMSSGPLRPLDRLVQPAASLGLGLILGLLMLAVIRLGIEPAVPAVAARMAAAGALPVWRRLLIIYVAAVGEEIVFRLILLSLVAGLTARACRIPNEAPNRAVVWLANGLAALAFAAVHLPAWTAVTPVSPGLALAVLSLNGVGGMVFGHVFVNRGIVAAVWTHAGADCAIQLIGPLTG